MLVQKLRLQRGWSQEQLAVVSGLSVRTIQRIERGQSGAWKRSQRKSVSLLNRNSSVGSNGID